MDGLRFILMLVVVLGVSGDIPEPTGQFFNCRHMGQEDLCDPGQCHPNGTSCVCTSPDVNVQDIHCVKPADAITCSNTCNGNGTCLRNSNGTDVCYCHQLYTGSDCELARAQVECMPESMTVHIRPHGTFMGLMYANDFKDTDDCQLQDDGTGTWTATFSLVPGQNNSCGVTNVSGTEGDEFKSKVRAMYNTNPAIYVASDQLLTFTCFFSNNVTIYSVVGSVDASEENLNQGTGDGFGVVVLFSIFINGDALEEADEVAVGTPLNLTITLQSNPAFDRLLVEECTAYNRPLLDVGNAGTESLPLVIQGCPASSTVIAGDHVVSRTSNGDPTVTIPVFAFAFVSGSVNFTNGLDIVCRVLLCTNDSDNCDPPICPVTPSGFSVGLGRRRRSVSEDIVTVGQTLTVRFGNSSEEGLIREGNNKEGVTEKCLGDPHLQTLLIAMGVALLALLLIILVLLVVLCRRRRRRRAEQEEEEQKGKGGDGLSPHHLHIPRPKLM